MSETTYPGVDEAAQAEALQRTLAGAPVAIAARPPCPPDRYRKELPSGSYADVSRRLIGTHQRDALRMMGKDNTNFPFAFVAVSCRINGRDMTLEDVLQCDYEDLQILQEETIGRQGKGRSSGETR